MKQATIDKAVSALDGMGEIVRAEMLTRRAYISEGIYSEKRAEQGAICGGRKACAIGALWLGYGIQPKIGVWGGVTLPGAEESNRVRFMRGRPGLKLAHEALNQAATDFAESRRNVYLSGLYTDPIEALFEGSYGSSLDKKDLLKIIAAAKRKVKAQAK